MPLIKENPEDQTSAFGIVTYAGISRQVKLRALLGRQGELPIKNYDGTTLSFC